MENLRELLRFLQPEQHIDLRARSLIHVFGLTGSAEGKAILFDLPEIIHAILLLTQDETVAIAAEALISLIHLTAEEADAVKVLETSSVMTPSFNLASKAIATVMDPNSELADPWSTVLMNLARVDSLVGAIIDEIQKDPATIAGLVKAFCQLDYNKKGAKLHYLGPFFCNITTTSRGRNLFCNPEVNVLEKIVPFVSFEENILRRGGIIGILQNVCFDPTYHEKVIDEQSCVFHNLLFPLVGPEDVTDEENVKFPIELQYLGKDKKREEHPGLRQILLVCLLLLCDTKTSREFLRAKGVYEILRDYHKWEHRVGGDMDALLACEYVMDILIKKEEEI